MMADLFDAERRAMRLGAVGDVALWGAEARPAWSERLFDQYDSRRWWLNPGRRERANGVASTPP